MKNSEYWEKRFTQLEEAQNKLGADALKEIEEQYREALKRLEEEIAAWYQRFADNNNISMAEARKWLLGKELNEFKWDVQEYIKHGEENALTEAWMKELENASARVHISRLEELRIRMQQSLEVMFGKQEETVTDAMSEIYLSDYYHTIFELQKGFNIGWDIAGIDQSKIEKILSKPWAADGLNFSDRIWRNKEKLIRELHAELSQNIIRGADPQKAINAIAKKMNTSKHNAGRLVMTEEAYFSSAAQKDAYTELGVEQFEIVATLDSHTSDICRELDGKVFPMTEYQPGLTAPPFHVYCRSTTVPHFDDDFGQIGERAARDVKTGKTYYVPADMKYEQWKEQQDAEYGAGTVDRERKKTYNKSADKKQFERYKEALRELAPKSFTDFQRLKYEDPEGWKRAKAQYRILNSYKIDSGNLTAAEILELDDRVITEKRTQFASDLKNSGNIAGVYLDGDIDTICFAHSRISSPDERGKYKGEADLALLKENRRFSYTDVPAKDGEMRHETWKDSEAKLFEYLADLYEQEPFKSITMLSERGMCDSCKKVMEQFKELHPDVKINVVSNKKVKGNVWKHRRTRK